MDKYKIAETKTFKKIIKNNIFQDKINNFRKEIYPKIKNNPFSGLNIKKLKGKIDNLFRYRIGKYRLLYFVDKEKKIIFISNIQHRKNAYKKL